jgi:hypothetical protein
MTAKKILVILILFFVILNCTAQYQDNIWYFGDSTGIDFTTGNAVALTNSKSWSDEANANICDNQGNLLFYAGFDWSNNFYVWNNQNNVMLGNNTITGLEILQLLLKGF